MKLPRVGQVISIAPTSRRLLVVEQNTEDKTFKTVWWTHVGITGREIGNGISTRGCLPRTNPNHQTWHMGDKHSHATPVSPDQISVHGEAQVRKVSLVTYYVAGGAKAVK